jgi:uncharacterized coiled-coil protein SlyX
MMTQTELLRLQENMNAVFSTHWDRIDKLEVELEGLTERLEALEKAPKTPRTPRKATKSAA